MAETQVISDVMRLAESLGALPEPMVKPSFIVVSGLPGTGKTYLSGRLAERLPSAVLESDALRKTLFPAPTYSAPESGHLFQTIHRLIEDLLKKGIPVILDATNLAERDRERLYHIADRLKAKLILVRVEAPSEVVYERLIARSSRTEPEGHSDADWSVFQKMQSAVEHIRRNHFAVDTSRDIRPALDKITREAKK
jgi:predicted kinase